MAASVARVTLVVGSEDLLVDRAISVVLAAARRGDPATQRIDVDASGESAAAALGEALSPTLFGDSSVVVVSSCADADDACAGALRAAFDDLPDGVWLVLLHPGGAKGKALLEAARKAGAAEVQAAPVTRMRDVLDFLTAEVAAANRRMTRDALALLYNAVGNDLPLLVGAVEQLIADIEADPIGEREVATYFEGVAEVSSFAIADAVWNRRPVEALRSMRQAVESGDASRLGPPTVGAIATGLRSLVNFAGAPRGIAEAEVARIAGVPPWKVRTLREQLPRWRPEWLAAAAIRLADADAAVKGGLREGENLEPVQKLMALERLVVETAAPEREER